MHYLIILFIAIAVAFVWFNIFKMIFEMTGIDKKIEEIFCKIERSAF